MALNQGLRNDSKVLKEIIQKNIQSLNKQETEYHQEENHILKWRVTMETCDEDFEQSQNGNQLKQKDTQEICSWKDLKVQILKQIFNKDNQSMEMNKKIFGHYLSNIRAKLFNWIIYSCKVFGQNDQILLTAFELFEKFIQIKYQSQSSIVKWQPAQLMAIALLIASKQHGVVFISTKQLHKIILNESISYEKVVHYELDFVLTIKSKTHLTSLYERAFTMFQFLKFQTPQTKELFRSLLINFLVRIYFDRELLESFSDNEIVFYLIILINELLKEKQGEQSRNTNLNTIRLMSKDIFVYSNKSHNYFYSYLKSFDQNNIHLNYVLKYFKIEYN